MPRKILLKGRTEGEFRLRRVQYLPFPLISMYTEICGWFNTIKHCWFSWPFLDLPLVYISFSVISKDGQVILQVIPLDCSHSLHSTGLWPAVWWIYIPLRNVGFKWWLFSNHEYHNFFLRSMAAAICWNRVCLSKFKLRDWITHTWLLGVQALRFYPASNSALFARALV